MFTRDTNFYDLVAHGLSSIGYTGATAFNDYVNDVLAQKYNIQSYADNLGFTVNPNLPISATYEQLDCTVRPYSMAGYVDIDSDGPSKSVEGMTLKYGGLPTFKHETTLTRKVMREKMQLAEMMGGYNSDMLNTVLDLLFTSVDNLIGGNYNTIAYQRHQLVSNDNKLVISATNNPGGIPLTIDFGMDNDHKGESVWYSKDASTGVVTEDSDVTSGTIDPIKVMKDIQYKMKHKFYAPQGHWEISERTWSDIKDLPYFKNQYTTWFRPDLTDAGQKASFGNLVEDDSIKKFVESRIGAKIVVVDHVSYVEAWDATTKKVKYNEQDSFKEGVMVYVPDGNIGDIQFARPVAMQTPGARLALFDGGRTLIRQLFEDKTMTQVIGSEVTGLCVPTKTRWTYRLKIK